MSDYLLIESRSESSEVNYCCTLAAGLAAADNHVAIFLVQNGVLPARRGARSDGFDAAAGAGVRLLADDFSLRERGIDTGQLRASISSAPLETIVDALARGAKVIWR